MHSEQVVDYQNFDFRSVWIGRADVDRFDRALVELALPHLEGGRMLEIGTGFGRLTPLFARGRSEYVGTDFDLGGLREAHAALWDSGGGERKTAWVGANVYHLPFADKSFTSVGMVRVYHHLADPLRALRELARILVPGGTALVTWASRSTLRSLVHDVQVGIGRPSVSGERRLFGAQGDHIDVRGAPYSTYVTTPARFFRDLAAAGLNPLRSFGGLEAMATRLVPFSVGLAASRAWPEAPVFSTRWTVSRKPGDRRDPCAWERLLACPRCGGAGPPTEEHAVFTPVCGRCGFAFRWDRGLLDARYVGGT